MIGQDVKPEEQSGKVCWQKDMDKVSQRMVVVCDESIWSSDGMLPADVVTCER